MTVCSRMNRRYPRLALDMLQRDAGWHADNQPGERRAQQQPPVLRAGYAV